MARKTLPPGRYRLTLKSYIAPAPGEFPAILDAGTEIVYAGVPGEHMEPLDHQAKINAGLVAPEPIAPIVAVAPAVPPLGPEPDAGDVEIPAGWRDLSWPARKSLASKLTTAPVMSGEDAERAILAELARRGG